MMPFNRGEEPDEVREIVREVRAPSEIVGIIIFIGWTVAVFVIGVVCGVSFG